METTLRELLSSAVKNLYNLENASFVVEHPKDLSKGDYATNIALVLGKTLQKSPMEIAKEIVEEIKHEHIDSISIAAPGFINIHLSRSFLTHEIGQALLPTYGHNALLARKRIMVEYTDPNPFKPFHIGHLMTNAIGESIARVLDASGAHVIRANYQGDVGLHVAKALYGLMHKGSIVEQPGVSEQAKYIGECYVYGSEQFEESAEAKEAINDINKKVYDRSDAKINELYDWGRKVTLEAFEEIYALLGTRFDYYFFESEMAQKGTLLVQEFLQKGVFSESEGAIVFHGEKYNPKLHTRVFITKLGLPTYETKEIGLTFTKFEKENLDQSIVITANEQTDYMAVATEVMRHMEPEYAKKMKHITHGMMRFASGKMSSRKGNVITGESLILDTKEVVAEKMKDRQMEQADRDDAINAISIGAIKYAILRQGVSGDIIYDEQQAVSFEGDSGPYLQYTATRAYSLIQKAHSAGIHPSIGHAPEEAYEIERLCYRFPEVVARVSNELEPHHITTYLIELASAFNSLYAHEVFVDTEDAYAPYKIALATAVHNIITRGLFLLGIKAPKKM